MEEAPMKRCPTCYNQYDERFKFCQKDGATLIAVAESQATGATAAAPARAFAATTSEAATSEPLNPDQSAASTIRVEAAEQAKIASVFAKRRIPILIGLAVMIAVAVAVISYVAFPSAKRSILAEVSKGNFVKPDGSSAYDLYLNSKTNLGTSDITEIANQVVPVLENRSEQILTRLKQEASESEVEWAESVRLYSWLNDMRPNPAYESRKYFSQARLEFMKKDYSRAITNFQRSIQLDPTWALPLNGLGRVYVNIRDRANAREYYRRACEVEPNWIYPWINLGALCLEMNDYKAAEESLKQALSIDPNKASAYYFLGQICEKDQRGCEAIAHYRQALANSNNSAAPGFNIDAVRNKVDRLEAKYSCR
jgi:tetratricopeptide (TPR) repeat protein